MDSRPPSPEIDDLLSQYTASPSSSRPPFPFNRSLSPQSNRNSPRPSTSTAPASFKKRPHTEDSQLGTAQTQEQNTTPDSNHRYKRRARTLTKRTNKPVQYYPPQYKRRNQTATWRTLPRSRTTTPVPVEQKRSRCTSTNSTSSTY